MTARIGSATSAYRDVIEQAYQRGIQLHVDDAGNLKVGGDYTDKFVDWAKRHKAELIAELRKSNLDALLDLAREGTDFSIKDCKTLFAPLDLQQIVSGELTIEAAKNLLEYQMGRVCRQCLGGGCKACDYFGGAHVGVSGVGTPAGEGFV